MADYSREKVAMEREQIQGRPSMITDDEYENLRRFEELSTWYETVKAKQEEEAKIRLFEAFRGSVIALDEARDHFAELQAEVTEKGWYSDYYQWVNNGKSE